MKLSSPSFAEGQPIPVKHTGEGADVSPALAWENVPQGTQEFALICEDPDAPTPEPWVHWILYKIPANVTGLPEGVPPDAKLSSPAGALQGRNSWPSGRTMGYRGPQPPKGHGTHHYHFRIFALDAPLYALPTVDKASLVKAMQGHILGEATLVGTYERK
jgi:Raf kinase inhibitor-like YbhB/YbcL family protein